MIIPEVEGQHTHEVARPERRGVSTCTVVDEAKAKVSTLDFADRLCGPGKLRRVGERWVASCPLPEHEDRSPSFTVYPGTESFFCYGCLVGGDVIELARHAWGYDKAEVATAAAMLLMEFGHEIPQRPPAWFRRQERRKPMLDALEEVKVRSAQRHLMRVLEPFVGRIEDDNRRREEAEAIWEDLAPVARLIVRGLH